MTDYKSEKDEINKNYVVFMSYHSDRNYVLYYTLR